MNRSKTKGGSDRAAMIGLLAVAALFLLIVGLGWTRMLSSTGPFISTAMGAGLGFIALGLAYYVASSKNEAGRWNATAVLPFLVLFCMSALGTLTTLFTQFQSQQIINGELTAAYEHVIKLRDASNARLDTQDAVTFRADANSKWEALRHEIKNPARCGQGPVANLRLQELQTVLPNFQLLSGLSCATAEVQIPGYEKTVKNLIDTSPIVLRASPIDAKRTAIIDQANNIVRQITKAQAGVARSGYSLNDVRADVADVGTKYAVLRQEAEAAAPGGFGGIPKELDMFQTFAIGNLGLVIPFMLSRLSDAATYVFLAAALVLDLAIVSAFGRIMRRSAAGTGGLSGSQPEAL
jgi:hypothetical protein